MIRNNKKNIRYLLIVVLFTFLLYIFKLTHYSFSIDTEYLINDSNGLLNSWYGIGRYGLCIFKNIFHTLPINITLTSVIATFFLAICSFLWVLYFEIIINKKLKIVSKVIGMLLIISSPIMMEQMGFVLQSIEIMVGFSLSAIGSILFVDYFEKKHKSSLVVSIILIFITFSFYQAFVFLFISAVIMYLICKNKDQQVETQNIINDVIISIFIFIIMFAVYFILDKYVLSILDLDKTSYLTNQFLWGTESINIILKSTFKNLIKVYSGYYNCYHPFFTILSFVFIYDYSLKDKKDYWKLFLSICLFIVPAILILITGSEAVGRSQFSIVITLSFYMIYFLENMDYQIIKIISIIIILFQSVVTVYLQVSAQNVYNLDKKIAYDIVETLQENHLEDRKIAIIGCYNPNKMLKGEVLGHSFFEWDNFDGQTSNGRVQGFFKCLGLDNQFVENNQLPNCYNLVKNKEIYLKNKKVYINDDIVIIKLSKS